MRTVCQQNGLALTEPSQPIASPYLSNARHGEPVSTAAARAWPRWALAGLLTGTAVLYLWGLSANGYGNSFYAAAAQAGSQSWSAWFFGSLDAHDFVTVDKPPTSLWVTGLSVRLFGLSSWSVLAPQALMGVASVAVLYATMRRTFSDRREGVAAGLLAGAVLACTPAAALMFRFNNPDALLVLLLVVAAYALIRAVSTASWRWLALVGALMGTAFLTKMLQGFMVLPGFAAAYLLYAPASWPRRFRDLLIGLAALVATAGWWVLVVALVPPTARPYIGGSTDNSVLNLAFGYNGISRLEGSPDQHENAARMHLVSMSGLHRLFMAEIGNEISWLLPAALACVVFGVYLLARRRLDRIQSAALVMWSLWLVATALVFSYMRGLVHPYYSVALAPAVAALIGMGVVWAWRRQSSWDGRIALAAIVALAGLWSAVLVHHNAFGPDWLPWAVASAAVAAAIGLVAPLSGKRTLTAVAALIAFAPVAAYSVATAATPHHGTIPSAVRASFVAGGWMGDESSNAQLADLLSATHTPWSAATNGSQSAAVLELASGTSVMAIGGWSGDPVPTLQQFIDDVHSHKVSYYVEAGHAASKHTEVTRAPARGSSHTREIADWVAAHYPAEILGSSTVYRLI